ncbi:unnamed protein product [Rhizoctonia solani]|uniref:Uncharacterized protein n=1 Tax=Rhizoctonia solani TaxID=456999 RepID=A0A8H3GKF5_9AGAM|nr:unnamed protein product [Rhizoctonia solani]
MNAAVRVTEDKLSPGFASPPAPVAVPQRSQGYLSLTNELATKNHKALAWQQDGPAAHARVDHVVIG